MKQFLSNRYAYVIVFALSFLQYANTLQHDYAWDDAIVITQNSRVQNGLADIPSFFKNISSNSTEYRYGYRPISLLTFATEVQLFGMNPHVSHFTNVLLYALLCCLILLLLYRLFPENKPVMLLAVLLYAVHPLHTEVVANIKSRDEMLSMFFGVSALLSFQGYISSGRWFKLLASAALMVLAFLSKESAVVLIGLMPVMIFYALQRIGKRQWLQMTGAVGMFLVLILLRAFVFSDSFYQTNQSELMAKGIFHYDVFLGNPLVDVHSKLRLLGNSMVLLYRYVRKFIWPWPLQHDYGFHVLKVYYLHALKVWVSTAVVIAGAVWTVRELLHRTLAGFGLAFFFITISIYMQLVALAPDMYAERFMFVPSLGLCIVAIEKGRKLKFMQGWGAAVLAAVLTVFFLISFNRNKAWKNNDTLYATDMPRLQDCVRAVYNYALFNHGKYYSAPESEKPALQKKILANYERAIELTDRLFIVYMDLGGAYMEFGYPEKALKTFKEAKVKFPEMAIPDVQIGKYYLSFKEYGQAIPFFESAITKGRSNPDFYYLLAICQFNTGEHQQAIDTLKEGEKLHPTSSAYWSLMARLYMKLSLKAEAAQALERGLQAFPHDPGLESALEAVRQQ